MSFAVKDANGQVTPEFAAYLKLTVVNHVYAQQRKPSATSYGKTPSFEEFMKALQNNEVVNPHYARKLPQHEIVHSRTNAFYNGNYAFEQTRLDIIAKAYELGMVRPDGMLLSTFTKTA